MNRWRERQAIEPAAVYQCFHKPYPRIIQSEWIKPIALGEYSEAGLLSERTGENIAHLNPYFNELSALYWIWRNTRDPIVGLWHYRRIMAFNLDEHWRDSFESRISASSSVIGYFTDDNQLDSLHRLMSCSDIIVPRLHVTGKSISAQYCDSHGDESWNIFIEEVHLQTPHLFDYTVLFDHSNLSTLYNMFVMRRHHFDAYCSDLFRVLKAVFLRIGARQHPYQRRYPGFLAERFLLLWLRHQRLRVTEVPIIYLTNPDE